MLSSRNSNIELLRIVSMLMVVMLHFNNQCANPGLLGLPDVLTNQLTGGLLVECVGIVAVNIFVLISGYFGINLKVRTLLKLYLQCLFIGLISYFLYVWLTSATLQIKPLLGRIMAFTHNHWWFVISYLCLMFVSPLLNVAVRSLPRKRYLLYIVLYAIIVIYLGWYKNLVSTRAGYSFVSFVFLYLIGRYVGEHISQDWIKQRRWCFLIGYVIGSLMLFGFLMLQYYKGISMRYVFRYDHPVVVFNACCLLLFALSFSFKSKIINWIASSVFTAYLLQDSIYFGYQWLYPKVAECFVNSPSSCWLVLLLGISVAFLILSVLMDKGIGLLSKLILSAFDKCVARIDNNRSLNDNC